MIEKPGKVINDAQEIIKKVYKETTRLKDDFAELISDIDATITYTEEYSYGTKYLHLKSSHTFLFSKSNDDSDVQVGYALIVIFYDEGNLKRISLKDEPELWVASFEIQNVPENVRPWEIYGLLEHSERGKFIDQGLKVGGEVYKYSWLDSEEDTDAINWSANFIGYPLVEITNKTALKEKIVQKLRV